MYTKDFANDISRILTHISSAHYSINILNAKFRPDYRSKLELEIISSDLKEINSLIKKYIKKGEK